MRLMGQEPQKGGAMSKLSKLARPIGHMRLIGRMRPISPMRPMGLIGLIGRMGLIGLIGFMSCKPEPPLHLFDGGDINLDLPMVKLDLEAYWDYETVYGIYNWHAEWYYGWDETDFQLFGNIGYTEPEVFMLRRYYTGSEPYAPHTSVYATTVTGNSFHGRYNWGFWDILVWNDVTTSDGVQSLNFDEQTTLDYVTAYTNQSMSPARYQAPRYTRAFYQPEELFSAYEQGVEINRDLRGFDYDPVNNVYIKRLNMLLEPVTYIYLTEVILHNNNGRITSVDGNANLSGMSRSVNVNTGTAGNDAITVNYYVKFKKGCALVPFGTPADDPIRLTAEHADIIGGRLTTFGMCGQTPRNIHNVSEVTDTLRHYMDVTLQFNNGMDSTFVFNVTDQVRRHWKGGVIRVELNVDTISIPSRTGGSGFDAVVKEVEDGGTYVFDM